MSRGAGIGGGGIDNDALTTALTTAIDARSQLVGSPLIKAMASAPSSAAPTMTSPPTVTQGTSVGSGLTTTVNANDSRVRWNTPIQTSFKSGAWTPGAHTIGTTGGLQQSRYMQLAFDFTGRYLDMDYRYYTNLKYRLWADEKAATAALTAPAAATNDSRQYLHFDFGAAAQDAPRRIVIEVEDTNALSIYGFRHAPTETLTAPAIPSPRVLVIGDSYARGMGYGGGSSEANAYPRQMGRLLGWADIWNTSTSVGGQGLVHANDQNGNYPSRFGYDIATQDPDLVIVQGSVNDGAQTPSVVAAALESYVADLRDAFPGVPILVTGPLYVATPTSAHLDINTAMAAKVTELGLPDMIDLLSAGVFSGTGAVGATTSNGNADWARNGTDFTHPTPAGANLLARWMAGQVARRLGVPV